MIKEWIITNGLGGFASSTDKGGMNTRKYHGLLVAPLNPPRNRTLILSKIDESIEINGKKYNLFTNEVKGNITEGYKYQKKFEKEIIPIYTYKVQNVIIEKSISMIYGKNAVVVMYKISNQKNNVKFNLTPLVNFRDFHSENNIMNFNYKQKSNQDRTEVKVGRNANVRMIVNGSSYNQHYGDMFYGMHYAVEEDRGYNCEENHFIPGTFEIEVKPNEDKKINFVCSLNGKYGLDFDEMEKIDGEKVIKSELSRINKQVKQSKLLENIEENLNSLYGKEEEKMLEELVKQYIVASDNFIVYRDNNDLFSLIAGFPWFLDWGRDAFISFEGLLLISRRFDVARDVLLTFEEKINKGLIPNGFSEYDGKPLYNSVDSALLFIDAVNKYITYTKDYKFVEENLFESMKQIIEHYEKGINISKNNIYVDKNDGLLVSGTPETQNTWMDAKVDGRAITPRNGKAVEINALWYNALKVMEALSKKFKYKDNSYKQLAEQCKESFVEKFYNTKKKCLYDVIEVNNNPEENDDKIRPNQLFAISLPYPVIDCDTEMAKNMFLTVTKKLLNKYGLQTLAKNEDGYVPIYQGGPLERDLAYHQGCTWPWLLGLYYDAMKNLMNETQSKEARKGFEQELLLFRSKIAKTFITELNNGNTIGSICELYDSKNAKAGKGAFAQAWSISEVFRIIFGK